MSKNYKIILTTDIGRRFCNLRFETKRYLFFNYKLNIEATIEYVDEVLTCQ